MDSTYGWQFGAMKKIFKKFRKATNLPRERTVRDDIHYLGFVVDTAVVGPAALTHALISLEQAPNTLYVATLAQAGRLSSSEAALVSYFRTIFSLAVKALLKCQKEETLEENAVIVDKTVPKYAKIGADLRNWARPDKVRSASEEFPKLRMAIHNSFFAARGTKRPLSVIWKGKPKPDTIFFWTPDNLRSAGFALDQSKIFQTVQVERLIPKTELSVESLAMLAESLISAQCGNAWLDLYRRSTIDTGYAPSPKWLNITSLQVEKTTEESQIPPRASVDFYTQGPRLKFTGTPLEFPKVVEQHKNILLTGPSGSGKTTTFRLLTNFWISKDQLVDNQNFCFYIRLKELENFLQNCVDKGRKIDLSELIGRFVASVLRDKCSKKDLENCETVRRFARERARQHKTGHPTVKEMLNYIRQEVVRWFREDGCQQSNVIVLIDGINELRPRLRTAIRQGIDELEGKACRVAIACRSNFADDLFPDIQGRFTRFELQEPDDQQIIEHLEYNIPGRGKQIFESQIKIDRRILSMAKNPFYLSLIIARIKKDPNGKIPTTRAELIESFTIDSIKRKHGEDIRGPEHLKDDMIYVVLPRLARWSLQMLTLPDDVWPVPFRDSKEFRDILNPTDALDTLKMAESYGLLKSSGLLEESIEHCGYPTFSHDNFRDFFAALYLRSLSKSELIKQLPNILEYFVWDEPLLLFLELCQSKTMCRKVVEFALSKDPVLAGMCARHANAMEGDLCIQIANAVSKLPTTFDRSLFICKIVPQDNIQLKRLSATYALEQLSVQELAVIAQDKSLSPSLRRNAWISIPASVGQDDFGFLKDSWAILPKKPTLEVNTVLVGITKIPTYEAFVFFTKAYKEIHTLPGFSTTDAMFGFPILALIAYSPTLSQALTAFSAEESPEELSVLISLVQKVTKKELPLLKKLIFHKDLFVATDASKLLVKVLGDKAIPTLLKRLKSLGHQIDSCEGDADIPAKFHLYEIRNKLLSLIVQLAPDIASSILVDKLKNVKNISYFTDLQTESDDRYLFLRLLADARTIVALEYLVSYACNGFNCKLADFCADLLEVWPDRVAVLGKLRDYTRNGYPPDVKRAKLLSVWLGADDFCSEAISIFEDLFSHTVLGHEFPAPTEGLALQFYKKDPKPWQEHCFEEALSMQPLAVRAMREIPRSETLDQVLQIMEWQCSTLNKKAIKIGLVSRHTSFSLLVECLLVLSHFASIKFCMHIIERFISSQCLINLSELITLGNVPFQNSQYFPKVTSSILIFCENVPEKYVPLLFSVFSKLHQECINRISSDESIDLEPISNILLSLCRRADDELVVDLLCSLKNLLCQNKKRNCRSNILSLMEAIKFIRGRRFLGLF